MEASAAPNLPKQIPSFDIIKNEKIGYNNGIGVSSTQLIEVFHYSREFVTHVDYKLLTVKLNIPYTGHDTAGKRSRIILYLDDEAICDGSMFNTNWELRPLQLEGICLNVKAGNHKIKLMACIEGGNLYIPALGLDCVEKTIKPEIFGRMIIIGQNKH